MPSIPLGLSAYKRADFPTVLLKNMFFEKTAANLEDQVAIISRPRAKSFALAGPGPVRGAYRKGGAIFGRIIVLSGSTLYRVEQTGVPGVGTATVIGTVSGSGRMSAEGNATTVVLTCGATPYYTDGTTLTAISMPDSIAVNAIDTLNGYFLAAANASSRFYWSAIGGTTFNGLNFAAAESQPDVLITLKVIGDELYLFGRLSIEVWQPTGDVDLPFQRIGGRIFGIGCTARDTVQKMNVGGRDLICWVGTDRIVYQTAPHPVRISHNGIEEMLRQAVPENLSAFTFSWNGHDFYALHIPEFGTFAFDLSTECWLQLTSAGRTLFRGAVSTIGPSAQPLLGDDTAGIVYELSTDVRDDNGDKVLFEFSGLLDVTDGPVPCKTVIIEGSTGMTPDPMNDPPIEMATSDDHGATFDDHEPQPLEHQGQRAQRVMWMRCGMMRRESGRIFRWRTYEPMTVRKAKYNVSLR